MRRLILEDPFSRAAIWSRNLAFFALVVALLGVALARQGLDPRASLAIEGSALAISALAVLSAFVAMVVIWRKGYRGLGLALGGLVLSGLLYAYPAYVAVQARGVPSLVDVSTSPDDPPAFATSAKAIAARRGIIPPAGPSRSDRTTQATLYPDLQTVTLDADADEAMKIVQKILKRRKWMTIETTEPKNFATGHIDAVVKTALMGFPADVTIRFKGLGGKTQVDIRSVARAGWQERAGSNAERVQDLASEIEDQNPES